jgi:hypothetical protein
MILGRSSLFCRLEDIRAEKTDGTQLALYVNNVRVKILLRAQQIPLNPPFSKGEA